MIYEYALDPALLADVNNCRTIFDNFKSERGKLISDVPRKWRKEAYLSINGIPHEQCRPKMKKALKRSLEKMLQECLCCNRQIPAWDSSSQAWLEFVATINAFYPFAAILTREKLSQPVDTYSLAHLFLDAPECWNSPTDVPVARNAEAIVDALMPMLRVSKQVSLIDRHIYPGTRRSLNVLKEILARVDQFNFGNRISKISLHSSDHRLDWQSQLEHRMLRYLPGNFEISCSLWPRETEHDRFVLTDVGCIQLGEGLDERPPDGTDEVLLTLISPATQKKIRARISGQPTYTASISK